MSCHSAWRIQSTASATVTSALRAAWARVPVFDRLDVVAAGEPVRVGQGRMPLPDVTSFEHGATASASRCVRVCGLNGGAIVSADRSLPEADVRIAADRHKYPLGWRARGVDEESQAASALLRHDRAEERVIRTMSVVLHDAWRRGSVLQP